MSPDIYRTSFDYSFLYEQRIAFGVTNPRSFAAVVGLTDDWSRPRPKPRVYDGRARQERDECRARI